MQKLTEKQENIIGALREAYWNVGAATTSELSERFKGAYSETATHATLKTLEKRGHVRTVGKRGNAKLWIVTD